MGARPIERRGFALIEAPVFFCPVRFRLIVIRSSSPCRQLPFVLAAVGMLSGSTVAWAQDDSETPASEAGDLSGEASTGDISTDSGSESSEADFADEGEGDLTAELEPSMLEASVGMRMYSRSFQYTDTLAQLYPTNGFAELPSYSLPLAPMAYVDVSFFPLAKSKSVVLQNIGLVGAFELGFATDVNYAGTILSQTHYRYDVGLKGRIPISNFSIEPVVAYGGHNFSIGVPPGQAAPFPSVNYSLIEMGSDIFWRLHPITIRAYGRFLLPLSLGDVASAAWYPSAKGLGSHFGGQVGFALNSSFDLLMSVDARLYGLDFNPVPVTNPPERVAGGATDQYISASLGLGFHFPKSPPPADE